MKKIVIVLILSLSFLSTYADMVLHNGGSSLVRNRDNNIENREDTNFFKDNLFFELILVIIIMPTLLLLYIIRKKNNKLI